MKRKVTSESKPCTKIPSSRPRIGKTPPASLPKSRLKSTESKMLVMLTDKNVLQTKMQLKKNAHLSRRLRMILPTRSVTLKLRGLQPRAPSPTRRHADLLN